MFPHFTDNNKLGRGCDLREVAQKSYGRIQSENQLSLLILRPGLAFPTKSWYFLVVHLLSRTGTV